MAEKGFPVDVALPAVIVPPLVIAMFVLRIGQGLIVWVYIAYLIIFMRHLAKTGGQKIKVKSLAFSTACAITIWIVYTQLVGGWFWNDDWVMEEALIATIRPVIILLLLNEFFGLVERAGKRTASAEQNYLTSLIRVGLIASLPLVVLNPLLAIGTIIFIPTIILFFIFYWASTETPLSLNEN